MACRDFSKAARAALAQGIPKENYSIMHLDLAAFDSVRQFVKVRCALAWVALGRRAVWGCPSGAALAGGTTVSLQCQPLCKSYYG